MAQLVQVRTNTRFNLNYEEKKLEPEIELIFLISKPEYSVNVKKGEISKNIAVTEVRIDTNPDGIKKLIGQLQALQHPLSSYENLAEAFNTIIVHSNQETDKK